jgi:ketosteroid isomerase-like protein
MRRRLAAIVFVAAGCATAPSAGYFRDLENRWLAALQAHDTAALNELLDDSFVDSTFRGGTRTKNDVLTGPAVGGAYRSVRLDDVNVRTYGRDRVIVTGVNVLSGPGGDTVRVRFTDVFRKFGDAWRAVSAQETLAQ